MVHPGLLSSAHFMFSSVVTEKIHYFGTVLQLYEFRCRNNFLNTWEIHILFKYFKNIPLKSLGSVNFFYLVYSTQQGCIYFIIKQKGFFLWMFSLCFSLEMPGCVCYRSIWPVCRFWTCVRLQSPMLACSPSAVRTHLYTSYIQLLSFWTVKNSCFSNSNNWIYYLASWSITDLS